MDSVATANDKVGQSYETNESTGKFAVLVRASLWFTFLAVLD